MAKCHFKTTDNPAKKHYFFVCLKGGNVEKNNVAKGKV